MREYGRILSALRYEVGRIKNEIADAGDAIKIDEMLTIVTEDCCYGSQGDCRCACHKLMMMMAAYIAAGMEKDAPAPAVIEMSRILDSYEALAFGSEGYGEHPTESEDTSNSPTAEDGVENPTDAQRADLPAAAFEPAAFFSNDAGDYDADGEFIRSKSKLPHHVNSVKNPDDNESVDIPRLRNALARFNQVDWQSFPPGSDVKARAHLERHADAVLYLEDGSSCSDCKREELEMLRRDLALFRRGEFDQLLSINDTNT